MIFNAAAPVWVRRKASPVSYTHLLAHVANDRNMLEAFRENKDIHRQTASQVFHMPEEMVTPLMRSRAKAVNFGIVYGIGAFSLAKDIGVTRREAESYINAYLDYYSGVRHYMEPVSYTHLDVYKRQIKSIKSCLPNTKSSRDFRRLPTCMT